MSVKKYRVYCNDESKFVTGWFDTEPSTCFNNNNHVIDTNQTTVIDVEIVSKIKISQTNLDISDADKYQLLCIYDTIQANETKDVIFNIGIDVNLFSVNIHCNHNNIGDKYDSFVNKDTILGIVTQDATDVSVIKVSQTVIDNSKIGFYIKFGSSEYYKIIDIGIDEITILGTCTTLTNDLVYIVYYMIKGKHFLELGNEKMGDTIIGSSRLKKTDVCGVTYYNNSPYKKKISIFLETTF